MLIPSTHSSSFELAFRSGAAQAAAAAENFLSPHLDLKIRNTRLVMEIRNLGITTGLITFNP